MLAVIHIPTADSTAITCDTINFTADGACLNNGGGTFIPEIIGPPNYGRGNFNRLTQLVQTQNPN